MIRSVAAEDVHANGQVAPPVRRRARRVPNEVLGALTLAASLALLWLAWMFARPLALLVAAVILANAVEPVVDALMRWMRRTIAITVIYVGMFVLVGVGIGVVAPNVTSQVREVAQSLPTLIERGRQLAAQWVPLTGDLGSALVQPSESSGSGSSSSNGSGSGSSGVLSLPLAIVSSAFEAMLVVFMSLYWLIAMPKLRAFLISLLPPDRAGQTRTVLEEIGQTMGGYVRGVLIEATLIGVIVFVGLWLIGVQYPLPLAVLAGIGEFLPYVGPIMAAAPAVLLALLESPSQALIVGAFYVVLQLVEGYILFPLVVGNQSEIPPLLIILGLLTGGAVGGVLGALVAVPVAGAVRILVLRVVVPALQARVGNRRSAVGRGRQRAVG